MEKEIREGKGWERERMLREGKCKEGKGKERKGKRKLSEDSCQTELVQLTGLMPSSGLLDCQTQHTLFNHSSVQVKRNIQPPLSHLFQC